MTKNENRQRLKNEALNKIRKLYHDKYKFPYDEYDDRSLAEQREEKIRFIIDDLERYLNDL